MNCYNHPSVVSVATCIDCGKGLCPDCAGLYASPICSSCNEERVKSDQKVIVKKYIPSAIGFALGFIMGILMSSGDNSIGIRFLYSLSFGYTVAGIPWGWAVLNFLTPKVFLFMSYAGWGLYFTIKACLSVLIGMVALPIGLVNLIIKHKVAITKAQNIKNNLANQ